MGGSRIPGPLNENSVAPDDTASTGRAVAEPGPIGSDDSGAIELGAGPPKITKVTKDWGDPPVVSPTFTPVISAVSLKAVLVELQKLSEWGTGGGNLSGDGPGDIIQLDPSADGKTYSTNIKGKFFMTLPKWTEYDSATTAQKAAWDAMIANLRMHEQEHVSIAYRGAQKLVSALKNLPVTLAGQKMADNQQETQDAQDLFDSDAQTAHAGKDFKTFPKVFLDTTSDPPSPPKKP